MRRTVFVLSLVMATFLACTGTRGPSLVQIEGESMGTTYVVRVVAELSRTEQVHLQRDVQEALDRVDRLMSHYRPDSEVSRLNRATVGTAIPLSTSTFEVVRTALAVSELSGGAYDITVAPLVRLWGFGPEAYGLDVAPSASAIADVKSRVGYRHLRVDDDQQTIAKAVAGLECDLSSIAKGYAVDQLAELLEERRLRHYMVEVGGEVRTRGKNDTGDAWRIGIEKPLPGAREIQRIVPLSGLSIASSGDYRNFHRVDGKLFSHLIDPRTGRPVGHRLAAVSVVDHTAMRADAFASALLLLGPDDGYDLAVEEDLAALFLVRSEDGGIEEFATPSFEQLFF